MRELKIRDIKFKNRLFLAPMVDVTDLPYRLICRKAGAAMAYTEMLYADAIVHENKKTLSLLKTSKEDLPSGVQITGNNPIEFNKVLPHLKQFQIIDINCGCPSVKLIGNQAGSYLLKNPSKIAKMIKILKQNDQIVTAKIRLGYKTNNVLKIAKEIEKAGAEALTVHARLAIHGKEIPADWKWIKKVKDNLSIPIIGNGDIVNGEKAKEMLEIADGAMIARAAIGDPLIFQRVLKYLSTGKEPEFNFKENISALNNYMKLAEKNNCIELTRVKYLSTNFLRNIKGAAQLRNQIMLLKTYPEVKKFIENL